MDSPARFCITVNGVQYSASQDIAALLNKLPPDLGTLVGIAKFKYLSKNPANSILLCEERSGLRTPVPLCDGRDLTPAKLLWERTARGALEEQ